MTFTIVLAVYALLIILITVITSKKQAKDDIGNFMANKGGIGVLQAVALVVGASVAGSGTVGGAQTGYTTGLTSIWPQTVGAIGIVIAMIFGLTKFYRVMALDGALSIPEALGKFFSPRVRSAIAIITAFAFIGMFAIQPPAIAAILAPAFGLDYNTVMWVGGLFCIFLACVGGLKSVSDTNILHTCVMYISLAIASILVIKSIGGGLSKVNSSLPASYLDPFTLGWGTVGAYLITTFGITLNPMSISPVFGCKKLKTAHTGLIISVFLLVPFAFAVAYIGMAGKAAGIDIAGVDAIYAVTDIISPVLSAIANVGILAAILSTAPMLAISAGGIISHDIYASMINRSATPKQELIVAKVSVLAIGLFGIIIGTSIPSIMTGLMAAIQMSSIPSLVLFMAVTTGRIDERTTFWGVVSGGAVAVVWYFLNNPFGLQPVWPSLIAAAIVMLPMLIRSKGKVYFRYTEYRQRLEYYKESNQL